MLRIACRAREAFGELETQDGSAVLSHPEWLALLTEREISSRATKRFQSRMRSAKLRHVGAAPEEVDYRTRRGLGKALFQKLLTGQWMRERWNLMITGPCGAGKTWLACALAQSACRDGTTVLYKRLPRLFGGSSPMVTAASHACSEPSQRQISRSWMIGDQTGSTPARGET